MLIISLIFTSIQGTFAGLNNTPTDSTSYESKMYVGAHVGSFGFGLQFAYPLSDMITLRATGSYFPSFSTTISGTEEGVVPSRTNQVFFTVHAQTAGYLTASKEVVILQEGHQHIVVEMINISDAPTGLSISEDEITAVPSSGVTDSEFTLSPSTSSTTGTTATVTIPAGTKLMDINSSAASGNVTATLAYSNPEEEGFSIFLVPNNNSYRFHCKTRNILSRHSRP